jgi:hypothetical protein
MLHRLDPRRLLRGKAVAPAANELPPDSAHAPREHYIPLRKSDLIDRLAADATLELDERAGLLQFAQLLDATIHHHYHTRLERLKQAYALFDPDADPRPLASVDAAERSTLATDLFDQFTALLERANFRRLSHEDLQAALAAASEWSVNVHVDLDIFERLEVFVRGDVLGSKPIRRWRTGFRPEYVAIPTYQRLAIIFKLKPSERRKDEDSAAVVLKLFKNIPKADVEMLLPGTSVRMSLFDQGKILLPTVSGVALTFLKLIQGAATLATASLQGLLAFLGLIGGTVGYGVKSFLGYLRARDKYQLNLTRSLYYQNLDNNAGVLFRLLDEAEEQEFRETLLAWWLLRDYRDTGATAEQLDQSAERWLRDICGLAVDFEIEDALDKLIHLGLAQRLQASPRSLPRYRATPIQAALETLDRAWDEAFRYHTPDSAVRQGTARRHVRDELPIRRVA